MNAQRTSAVKGGSGSISSPANNTDGFTTQNRRKRSNSDAAAKARRESFADQAPKAGFVGSMWNSFVKGV
ncbi:hypothetical protein DID88_004152 [Monilinia fructigena]|uniref:Conidiation-specific protein 8 n=1 Tax=Monilinia fructigena TaxID=38457 RepID=A0A395IRX5_9HELO|nr:hypothetical protein DID88_004152 [Monilinia fructigena]